LGFTADDSLCRGSSFGTSRNPETEAERFLKGLRPNSLEYFEVLGHTCLGPRCIAAMKMHLDSLVELKLAGLPLDAIAKLPSLKAPPALRVLVLKDSYPSRFRNSAFYTVVSSVARWLCSCKSLRQLELNDFVDDPTLLAEALPDSGLRLTRLSVWESPTDRISSFHQALASQSSLQSLILQGQAPDGIEDDSVLVQVLAQLGCLRELVILSVDTFTPSSVQGLAPFLPRLERLVIGGCDVGDSELGCFLCIPKLRDLGIHALSTFSTEGILDFISRLGPESWGFYLKIATSRTRFDRNAKALIRDTLMRTLNGDFTLDHDGQENYTFATRLVSDDSDVQN
jgi:hypothetical protein